MYIIIKYNDNSITDIQTIRTRDKTTLTIRAPRPRPTIPNRNTPTTGVYKNIPNQCLITVTDVDQSKTRKHIRRVKIKNMIVCIL